MMKSFPTSGRRESNCRWRWRVGHRARAGRSASAGHCAIRPCKKLVTSVLRQHEAGGQTAPMLVVPSASGMNQNQPWSTEDADVAGGFARQAAGR